MYGLLLLFLLILNSKNPIPLIKRLYVCLGAIAFAVP
jgi:hypothetical protein